MGKLIKKKYSHYNFEKRKDYDNDVYVFTNKNQGRDRQVN